MSFWSCTALSGLVHKWLIVSVLTLVCLGCLQKETTGKWRCPSKQQCRRTSEDKTRGKKLRLLLISVSLPDYQLVCVGNPQWISSRKSDSVLTPTSTCLPAMLAGWGEVERLQKGATVAWQGPQSGRPPSKEQRINIREKISQWEVLSQQSSSPSVAVKAHTPPVSPSLSGDQHGNGFPSGSSKPNISKVKTLALDFRECSANTGHLVGFRKSEPLQRPSTGLSPTPQLNKQFTARTLQFPKVDNSTGNQTISTIDAQKIDCILDVEAISKPLPLSTDDLEDNMPAGNFYTSRGFWRKLEGDRLLWEKGRGFSGGPQAPPKPQRTFQYSGPNNHSGHTVQLEKATSCVINSDSSRRRIAKPPNFPPPPHPGTKTNGLTRHKKNRLV